MKPIYIFLICLSLLSDTCIAANTLKSDRADFKDAFISAADTAGPSLLQCGRSDLREEMINDVEFLLAGYVKLNNTFPVANPPIRQQILQRNDHVCLISDCTRRSDEKYCQVDKKTGKTYHTSTIDDQVIKIKARLIKSGFDPYGLLPSEAPKNSSSPENGCNAPAQYYQDAYERTGRVNDLICLKRSLARELR